MDTSETFRKFKFKFRRRFALEFPEEENISPSFFALRSYGAIWAIAQAENESKGKFTLEEFSNRILSSKFDRLYGNTSFRNGKLWQSPTFDIINVIGLHSILKGWTQSPELGLSKNVLDTDTVYWPGGLHLIPKGWTHSYEGRSLKIGVLAKGAFTQFVDVNYNQSSNKPSFNGLSIMSSKQLLKNWTIICHMS
ncbi:hypothetical protein VNO77_18989 [Canavalia gladiata]|uniref:Uncharacterized protein n=1 Tax=Canavalia gladiata TaxID=3824 RepID=A0AAN9LLU6_CANGL